MTDDTDSTQAVPMRIGEVAARTELSVRSLRHWEDVGLLRPSGRTEGGFRLYTEADVEKIFIIRRMKPLGFTLEQMGAAMRDIESLMAGESIHGVDQGPPARQRLTALLGEARERRTRLERQMSMAEEFISQLGERLDLTGAGHRPPPVGDERKR